MLDVSWAAVRELLETHGLYAVGLATAGGLALVSARAAKARALLRVIAVAILLATTALLLAGTSMVWGWALASVAPFIVLQHAIFLVLVKPRFVNETETLQHLQLTVARRFRDDHQVKEGEVHEVYEASRRFFAAETIALRYGIPGLLLLVLGLTLFYLLNPVSSVALASWSRDGAQVVRDSTLTAARLGALGAFAYVLFYLGTRAFRHDISSGAANWAMATLALGPVLAAIASKVWGSDTAPTGAEMAVYFLAGFSPRAVASAIEEVGRRTFAQGNENPVPSRTQSLLSVRGMTPSVVERLSEEGITDVSSLAMADPIRLQRDSNFDKRQILNWLDEALLCHFAPQNWQKLQDAGVSGAIDLGWYGNATPEELAPLATAAGFDPQLLAQLSRRLREDAQVRLVWMLYQMEVGESGGPAMPSIQPQEVVEEAKQAMEAALAERKGA